MSGLEIVGAAALYCAGVLVLAYIASAIAAILTPESWEIAILVPMIYAFAGVLTIGAAVGLFLLGAAIL